MARKPRIAFPGAIYHVTSRGNYRKELFREPGSGEAFERALFEAADFSNWLVHAYTIMSNHYHLVIETPDANLSAGMQWLQGTYANRFNRFHQENGHVFQGRFKSPLVEPGEAFRRVVDYVHLNPVRAGLVRMESLRKYRLSSYHRFWEDPLPKRLVRGKFLSALGLPDSIDSMPAYEACLATREEGDPDKEKIFRRELQDTWAVGSDQFRELISHGFSKVDPALDWSVADRNELLKAKWERIVQIEFKKRGLTEQDVRDSPKLAFWKLEISRILREQTTVSNRWIAGRLNMGHPSNVSRYRGTIPKSKG